MDFKLSQTGRTLGSRPLHFNPEYIRVSIKVGRALIQKNYAYLLNRKNVSEKLWTELLLVLPIREARELLASKIVDAQGLFNVQLSEVPPVTINHNHSVNFSMNSIIEQTAEQLNKIDPDKKRSWKALLISFATNLRLLWKHWGDKETIALLITNFIATIGLSDSCIDYVTNFASEAVDACTKKIVKGQMMTETTGIECMKWAGGLFSAIISGLILQKIPGGNKFDVWLTRFSKGSGVIRTVSELVTFGKEWMGTIIETVKVNCFGYNSEELGEWDNVDKWFKECLAIVPNYEQRLNDEPEMKQTVDTLFERGLNICKLLDSLRISTAQRDHVSKMMLFLANAREKASHVGAGQIALRVPPSIFHFYGNSGVGKSSLLACLNADIQAALGVTDPKDINLLTYYRQPGREFWDGYRNAVNVVVCDDFGAIKDTENRPNEEFLEAIRMSNTASYMLNMADLKDKGQTYFNAKAVIWTSNQSLFECKSLTNYEAVLRRVTRKFRQRPHPDYCKKQLQNDVLVDVLDNAKIKEKCKTNKFAILDCILFDEASPQGGFLQEGLTFREMSDLLVGDILNNVDYHEEFNNTVTEYGAIAIARRNVQAQLFSSPKKHNSLVSLAVGGSIKQFMYDDPVADHSDLYNAYCVHSYGDVFKQRYADAYLTALCSDANHEEIFSYLMGSCTDYEVCYDCLESPKTNKTHLLAEYFSSGWNKVTSVFQNIVQKVKSLNMFGKIALTVGALVLTYYGGKILARLFGKKDHIIEFAQKVMSEKAKAIAESNVSEKQLANSTIVITTDAESRNEKDKAKPVVVVESRNEKDKAKPVVVVESRNEKDKAKTTVLVESRNEIDKAKAAVVVESRNEVDKAKKSVTIESRNGDTITKVKIETAECVHFTDRSAPMEADCMFVAPEVHKLIVDETVQAQAVTDKNAAEVVSKLYRNMYKLESFEDGKWMHNMNLLIIKGRLAIVNRHVVCKKDIKEWRIRNAHKPEGFVFDLFAQPNAIIPDNDIHGQKDIMMIELPRVVEQHPDITNSFMTSGDFSRFTSLKQISLIGFMGGPDIIMRQYFSDRVRAVDAAIGYKAKDVIIQCRQYFEYGIQTVAGDCGSVMVAFDTNFNNKIFGIHSGGQEGAVYTGFGTPVTRGVIEKLQEILKCYPDARIAPAEIIDAEYPLIKQQENGFVSWIQRLPFMGGFQFLGTTNTVTGNNVVSQIKPSPVHGVITEPTMKPAYLGRFKNKNGEIIDPMALARAKASPAPVIMNKEILDSAQHDFMQLITSHVEEKDRRILTFEEAIKGIEGDDLYSPINRRTSPGFGWSKTGVGKTRWLGEDEYILDHPEIVSKYNTMKEVCKTTRPSVVWVDTLKDERRPIEKVDKGKTRLFSCGEMVYTILFRQYFMGFIAHMMRHKIDYESCVGVNVYSRDWTKLATAIQTKGNKVIAGDFGNYDGTLNAELLWRVLDVVEAFYKGTEEERNIRRHLWCEIVNSIHVSGKDMYMWTHSQPSGCPMTTILNCCYHSISARYVYLLCAYMYKPSMALMSNFRKHVVHVNYGDDDIWNISDEIIEWFNQVTISQAYATFGMEYTDETKTGEIVPHRQLNQINFLKRTFRWDNNQMRYRAPLTLETVKEMAMWNRKTIDKYQLTSDVLQEAVHELAQHDKSVFDAELPSFEKARVIVSEHVLCAFETYEQYQKIEYIRYVEE